jgi:uncharacterized membrane protein
MKTTFGKKNYQIFIAGIALIILGYLLMIGGGSEDPNVFNPAIFDTQRITIAPIVCLLGFVTVVAGIMWQPKTTAASEQSAKTDAVKN